MAIERPDFRSRGRRAPVTIRCNNPGAMWHGPHAKKWGALAKEQLNDGLGQGNNAAVFKDAIDGAAALFALLASRRYAGKPLKVAIATWSGGNHVESYLRVIQSEMQITPDTVLTRSFLTHESTAIPLAKAMAKHETGKAYPLSDDQWGEAFLQAFPERRPKDMPEEAPPAERTITTEVGDDPKPLPPLTKVSRKASLLDRIRSWLAAVGIGGGGLTLADVTGQGGENVKAVSRILASNGLILLAAGCVAGSVVAWLLLRYMEQDRDEGRYTPSGE